MLRCFIALALVSASISAVAGPECEKCGNAVREKIAACRQAGGKDCDSKYKDEAMSCANTCQAEADKARQKIQLPKQPR